MLLAAVGDRAADRVRERRQPAAGPRQRTRARGRRAVGTRREPVANRASVDGREPRPLGHRRDPVDRARVVGRSTCFGARCRTACLESRRSRSTSSPRGRRRLVARNGCRLRRCSSPSDVEAGPHELAEGGRAERRPDTSAPAGCAGRGGGRTGRRAVVGAALFIGSFIRLMALDPGFKPDGVLTMQLYARPAAGSVHPTGPRRLLRSSSG